MTHGLNRLDSVARHRNHQWTHHSHTELHQEQESHRDQYRLNVPVQQRELDPITHEELGKWVYTFAFDNSENRVSYNIRSLAEYFLKTGEFTEPTTRVRVTEKNVREIDMLIRKYDIDISGFSSFQNLWDCYKARDKYEEKKHHENLLLGLERLTSESIESILKLIESNPSGSYERSVDDFHKICDEFDLYYEQLVHADRKHALASISHWLFFIKGPPNKPTKDSHGFLRRSLEFLEDRKYQVQQNRYI